MENDLNYMNTITGIKIAPITPEEGEKPILKKNRPSHIPPCPKCAQLISEERR